MPARTPVRAHARTSGRASGRKPARATPPEPRLISPDLLGTLPLPDYDAESDKGDRGKLLVIAGSRRIPGAAVLACRAALRVGAGNVRLAAVESIAVQIGIMLPPLMVIPLPETASGTIAPTALPEIEAQYGSCHSAVLGPGLDEVPETAALARRIGATMPLPALVDAHALTALAGIRPSRAAGPRVFTPRLGEMATLSGVPEEEIERDRPAFATRFAREWQVTLVLKGRETLIAAPDGTLYLNTAGSRVLGTAGSGDTLAGIIGGLLTQRMDATAAAAWGVYLHALAGEDVARELGEDGGMANDFVERLPSILRSLRSRTI